jgi:cytidylate kinase
LTSTEAITVAIDGPSASGKSTVARRVAGMLRFVYVDSGSLYRGVTWKAVREGVDPTDREAVIFMLENMVWDFELEEGTVVLWIDGERPGRQLRSESVAEAVSDIAGVPEVRCRIVSAAWSWKGAISGRWCFR